jgi:hypothetical protein
MKKIYKYKGIKHPEITRKSYRDYTHVVLLYAKGELINKSFCRNKNLVKPRINHLRNWHEKNLILYCGYELNQIEYVVDEVERE